MFEKLNYSRTEYFLSCIPIIGIPVVLGVFFSRKIIAGESHSAWVKANRLFLNKTMVNKIPLKKNQFHNPTAYFQWGVPHGTYDENMRYFENLIKENDKYKKKFEDAYAKRFGHKQDANPDKNDKNNVPNSKSGFYHESSAHKKATPYIIQYNKEIKKLINTLGESIDQNEAKEFYISDEPDFSGIKKSTTKYMKSLHPDKVSENNRQICDTAFKNIFPLIQKIITEF